MKAVKKFKGLVETKRPDAFARTLGKGMRIIQPLPIQSSAGGDATTPDPRLPTVQSPLTQSKSVDIDDRRNIEQALATEGIHQSGENDTPQVTETARVESPVTTTDTSNDGKRDESVQTRRGHTLHDDQFSQSDRPELHSESSGEKGHAQDPLEEPPLFLGIGSGVDESLEVPVYEIIAESPMAVEFNIYDTAYQEEVERIRAAQGHTATVYLTRRVDTKQAYKADENMVEAPKQFEIQGRAHEGFKGLLDRAREKEAELQGKDKVGGASSRTFTDIAREALENTKATGKELSDKSSSALGSVAHKVLEKKT